MLLAAVLFGVVVGLVNGLVVVELPHPADHRHAGGRLRRADAGAAHLGRTATTTFANRTVTDLIRASLLGLPTPFFVVLVVRRGGVSLLVNRTPLGRSLLARRAEPQAAYLSGIAVDRTILFAYVVSGVARRR